MKNFALFLVFTFLFSVPAQACLNGETRQLADGSSLYQDDEGFVPYGHRFSKKDDLQENLRSLEAGYRKTGNLDYLSDQGLILIILGEYRKAIDLYQKVEKREPGRYSTASNMGTAYELMGNNKEALRWIEKAVAVRPDSHFGSEWIHVNILKAKIKGGRSVTPQFLTGQDFGNRPQPVSGLSKKQLFRLRKQLYYQLNERISFVRPKDPVVAILLFDLANVSYLMGEKAEAAETYEMAKEYGFDRPVLDSRIRLSAVPLSSRIEKKVKQEVKHHATSELKLQLMTLLTIAAVLVVLGSCIYIFRKKLFPKRQ